jgi:sugar/nucleoside kinase (ribokinase family)
MGLSCRAVGGVGDDLMGNWVLQRLKEFGVDVSGMQQIASSPTSSSIVTTRRDGSRPALHMKGVTADFFVEDHDLDLLCAARIVHLGGVELMDGWTTARMRACSSERSKQER